MNNYIDGFVFPVHRNHLEEYREVAQKVSAIWKECCCFVSPPRDKMSVDMFMIQLFLLRFAQREVEL